MAATSQTIAPPGQLKSFQTLFIEPGRFRTSEPMGLINFVSNTTISAVGAGNTKELLLRFDLPTGFLYLLSDLMVRISGADAEDWYEGSLRTYFGIDTPTAASIEMDFPMVPGRIRPQDYPSSEDKIVFGGFSGASFNSTGANIGMATQVIKPPYLFQGRPVGDTTNPTFRTVNGTATTGTWTLDAIARFFFYPIEQGDNSALYWQQPVT